MESTPDLENHSEADLRLNAIFQTATDGIITINHKGIMELVNPAAAHLFGYQAAELIGKNVHVLMGEPYHSAHDDYIENYRTTGVAKIIGIGREVKGKKKNGTMFPFRLSISEVKLKNRTIFTGIVHDLTDQKKAEIALKQEQEKVKTYLDIANTIFVVLDTKGEIVLLNQKGGEILKVNPKKILGESWLDLFVVPQEKATVKTIFKSLINQVGNYETFENKVVAIDGEIRLIAWRNSLLYNSKEEVIGTISSGIDITNQRKAEQRILKLNEELEQKVKKRTSELAETINKLLKTNQKLAFEIKEREVAELALRETGKELRKALEKEKELSELKSRFVSMASHEFRTPLSSILSSTEIIELYTKSEQQIKREKHTKRIKSAVSSLTGILNDFLSLSKLEEGKTQIQATEFELGTFCEEVLGLVKSLLKPGQHLQHINTNFHQKVFMDKNILKNILLNLMSNAVKYSEEGKTIYCNTTVQDNHLIIEVKDEGIGIPKEDQKHLFTRFFRANNVENIKGTGLGLNIVQRYVDLMNGSINFESEEGRGSVFKVRLPLHIQE